MINNFIKRAITGVLFVAILVGCILYDAFSFGILFTAISALTIYEFGQLVNMRAEGVKINKTINMLGGAVKKELVYGYTVTLYKLKENLQTWVLPVVLNVRKVAR